MRASAPSDGRSRPAVTRKRGPKAKPTDPRDKRIAELERGLKRAQARAERAEALVEVQKKLLKRSRCSRPWEPLGRWTRRCPEGRAEMPKRTKNLQRRGKAYYYRMQKGGRERYVALGSEYGTAHARYKEIRTSGPNSGSELPVRKVARQWLES